MNANVYGTVNLLHLDSVRDALEERDKRIAELEAINSSMADDLCSMTGAYERAEQLEERVRELEAENERLRELMTNRPTTLSAWDNAILDRAERAEAENKALRDKLAELTQVADAYSERVEAELAALKAENERWVWVAHMVWTFPDDHPEDARSYPSRLAAKWRPGLSFHDGCFYGSLSALEETP